MFNMDVEWHCQTFPSLTTRDIIKKFVIELNELYKEQPYTSKHLEELADCLIVAVACFWRFDVDLIDENYVLTKEMSYYDFYTIQKAIDAKMKINKKRSWECVNGEYRHIETKVIK